MQKALVVFGVNRVGLVLRSQRNDCCINLKDGLLIQLLTLMHPPVALFVLSSCR